jgi:hypothetical protein
MKIFVTYDPLSVLQGGFHLEERILEDLKRHKQPKLVAPADSFPSRVSGTIGFDTEYAPDGALLTTAIADRGKAKAIETNEDRRFKTFRPFLRKAKVIVGHSITGDIDYLVKNKLAKESWLRGEDIQDSLLLARMVDENRGRGSYGLETLLLSAFNFNPWKSETEKLFKKTKDASQWSISQRTERCRIDAWATLILAEYFYRRLHANSETA